MAAANGKPPEARIKPGYVWRTINAWSGQMDNGGGIGYESDVEDIEFNAFVVLLVAGVGLGALAVIWLLPRTYPRYFWTFCIFLSASLVLWLFGEPVGALISLVLAGLVPVAKFMNVRERLRRTP